MSKIITFPYIFNAPIIPVEIHGSTGWTFIQAYVDSGASFSIFTVDEAIVLGLDYTHGKMMYITVGDGSSIPVYLHQLHVKIGYVSFHARIGFSPRLGVGFNLLGRQDIFSRFDITFSDKDRIISFLPRILK